MNRFCGQKQSHLTEGKKKREKEVRMNPVTPQPKCTKPCMKNCCHKGKYKRPHQNHHSNCSRYALQHGPFCAHKTQEKNPFCKPHRTSVHKTCRRSCQDGEAGEKRDRYIYRERERERGAERRVPVTIFLVQPSVWDFSAVRRPISFGKVIIAVPPPFWDADLVSTDWFLHKDGCVAEHSTE